MTTLTTLLLSASLNVENHCPTPIVEALPVTSKEIVQHMVETTRKGCERIIGKGSCLLKLQQVREDGWYATCSSPDRKNNDAEI